MNRKLFPLIATAAVVVGLLNSTTRAAAGHQGEGGQRLKQALAQLDLSASQKQQIKQIVTEAKSQRQASGGQKSGDHQAGRAMLKKIMDVLTPEQRAKLKKILQSEKSTAAAKA